MTLHSILSAIPIPPMIIDFILAILPFIISLFGSVAQVNDYFASGTLLRAAGFRPSCCEVFDFIVVGAGSAGAAVAARLSEDPSVRVLLLDAGGNPNLISYIPVTASFIATNPFTDWGYHTLPQNGSALGLVNQQVHWPRGRSLGGSSNSNYMIYMKGNRKDYDRWAEHTGDSRWRHENVERYYRKIEDYFGIWDGKGVHGKGGPLRVERIKYTPGMEQFLEAAQEMGYKIRDLNHNQKEGFSPLEFTQNNGIRFSTYRAYILPNLVRENLIVYRYTLATKILLDRSMRATGVSYLRHGVAGEARVRREVIVSAGTLNSPQLLMLSGIGPWKHLQEVGIEARVNLPVGQNLQDHVTTAVGPFIFNRSNSLMLYRDVSFGTFYEFLKGRGLLTSPQALTTVGLVSTSDNQSDKDWPNIMFTVAALGLFRGIGPLLDNVFNSGTLAHRYLSPLTEQDAHLSLVTLGLPESRGYVRLRNRNPMSAPIINPRYYSDPKNKDIKAMMKGVRKIVEVFENTTVMQRLDAHLPNRELPGCEGFQIWSDAYLECFIRTVTLTLFHPTSTCSMGKIGDPKSVVDSQLRVIGVKGLRVADASVMPYVTNANTNAPSILIGEMAADMVKRTWNLQ